MIPDIVAFKNAKSASQAAEDTSVVSQDAQGLSQAVIDLKAAKQDLTELNKDKSGLETLLKQILTKV